MFAQVELPVGAGAKVLTVPISAVIDSGTRQIALVQLAEGRFEPREVKLGARSDNYLQVLQGVREGEAVVVSANFLIDAESNLKAAIAGFGAAAAVPAAAQMPAAASGHSAQGKVVEVDPKAQSVTISHGAVPDLKWSAMTMEFQLANSALLTGLQPGAPIAFEFVERGKGEWVITKVMPSTPAVK
jgi:Cu(I)/Ag(I) efflux system membrane fusion protein/cobalt-zinc-cadmium efflux system membrane fusion protein